MRKAKSVARKATGTPRGGFAGKLKGALGSSKNKKPSRVATKPAKPSQGKSGKNRLINAASKSASGAMAKQQTAQRAATKSASGSKPAVKTGGLKPGKQGGIGAGVNPTKKRGGLQAAVRAVRGAAGALGGGGAKKAMRGASRRATRGDNRR